MCFNIYVFFFILFFNFYLTGWIKLGIELGGTQNLIKLNFTSWSVMYLFPPQKSGGEGVGLE